MSYGVTYWTRGEVRTTGSSRQRIGFYELVGVARWVVDSEDGGQLISCHTCNPIFNFCEIIFGFPTPPAQLSLVQTVLIGLQIQKKACETIKIWATKPMGMCNNTQRANLCFRLFRVLQLCCSLTKMIYL